MSELYSAGTDTQMICLANHTARIMGQGLVQSKMAFVPGNCQLKGSGPRHAFK